MTHEQPPSSEGAYLLYLLQASADGAVPAWRTIAMGDVTWLERQERAALYALGRIRESICHRVKRLPGPHDADQRAFLMSLLAHCQGADGGNVTAPSWPAANLGTVVGMIRNRMLGHRSAA